MGIFVELYRRYFRTRKWVMLMAIGLFMITVIAGYSQKYLERVMVDHVLEVNLMEPEPLPPGDLDLDNPIHPFAKSGIRRPGTDPLTLEERIAAKPGKSTAQKVRLLVLVAATMLAIYVVRMVLGWHASLQLTLQSERAIFELRRDLHRKLLQLPMRFFDQEQTGQLVSRVINDVQVIRVAFARNFVMMIVNVFNLAVGVVLIYSIDLTMALIATATLPFYVLVFTLIKPRVKRLTRAIRQEFAKSYSLIKEKLTGIRVVKTFQQEAAEVRRFYRRSREITRMSARNELMNTVLAGAAMIVTGAGTTAILWYGALKVRSGELTLGLLMLFVSTMAMLFGPLQMITNQNIVLQRLMVIIDRLLTLLKEDVSIHDEPDAVSMPRIRGHILFEHVALRYENSFRPALENINLEIEPGTRLALLGPSGAGKTTLANLLMRLYEPTEGTLFIDGIDIRRIRLTDLRTRITMVGQDTHLFRGTIAENIMYGNFEAGPTEVMEAAKAAEIHEFVMTLPGKYETTTEEQGQNFSGGQKQRLSLARALLTNPDILILDDCTSALDASTTARIQDTLDKVMEGRTTIVITHRVSMAMKCGRIVVLNADGRVVQDGAHEQLLQQEGFYRQVYEEQS